ncbi:unnamed protein product [Caenorhabditis auriculariae]|uniref:FERM domain-containing protein n=1 Tax=Caenorhabditis auriculariae TaxID=2777116 RepID=A0A8S1GTQ4_9PELO|nr:unnamed protein product [Caenorhabditis auriculariae]
MGVLSLNVVSSERGVKKTMQFEPSTLVFDAAKLIREKFNMNDINPNEYGLFRMEDDPSKCVWMENGRTLEYYLVRNQDRIEYKKKIRLLKVRMLDGAVKAVQIDESLPVSQLMLTICNKIGISNYEEYSLVRDGPGLVNNENSQSNWNLREERSRSVDVERRTGGGLMGTLGRRKDQKMEEMRHKLHTDEELAWVEHGKTLREQNIADDETLLLRRKFFFSDTNVDSRDPVQLNLLYVQCRDGVLRGLHPVNKETALHLAALQAHIQYGDFPHDKPKFQIDGRDLLPKEYAKNKENEKKVVQFYKELTGTQELDAKSKYVHLCRELKTYGVTFFVVKEKMPGKNKLVPRLLGVNKESVMRVDEKTKEILKEWPLEQVRRWASSGKTFNLDFGDYQDGYYSVQTSDGEKIGQLIGGYIDIILKKKRTRDHQGIEGDEGSTMLEDVVAPAKATLVAHGQIGAGQRQQDHAVAVRGVLRTPQGHQGYGINGAQYGAVSGEVTSQHMARAQRMMISDMHEHPQRALIGTIEATIRAIDEAEEELQAEPYIELPKFKDEHSAHRWVDEQMAVNKENVNERLAAMGAATAQVVQWTATQEQDEYDDRVGTAIATIGSNLPDVSRNVRDFSAMMSQESRGDLMEATRRLCGAFSDFMTAVNPEHEEKRTKVFAAAGRVGDFSQQVINNMEERTEYQQSFDETFMQRAKHIATSTAQLVLCAKTISAECDEDQKETVVRSATDCAYATSQLVACARVVAPTIENPACQQQLTSAATQVSHNVQKLIYEADSVRQPRQESLRDIHSAARQVTNALDSLLEYAKTSPKTTTTSRTEEEEEYNQVLRRTNRMIAHQGPSEDLTREAKKVIRHSQILMEQFEHEATQRPEQRDRLLDAARRVATATSDMIDATRDCESRPTEAESEMALRTAAEKLARVTTETTSDQQEKHIMQRLEQAAKQTTYDATQTIAAANAAKEARKRTETTEQLLEVVTKQSSCENLLYECAQTAEHLPRLITSIRESQSAKDPSSRFRAQSRLIRDSQKVLTPATQLVDSSRNAVSEISEVHFASGLSDSSNRLDTTLAELRTALNDAQQLNFSQQLIYSEELIRELDQQLLETQRGQRSVQPPAGATATTSTSKLMSSSRHVGSGVAQLISAASSSDERHIGSSAVELAQNLRGFTDSVTEVVATRTDIQLEKLIVCARSVVHESGRVFDRVREKAPPPVLADTAKQVSTSLRQVIACIPDTEHIEKAIAKVQTSNATANVQAVDLRTAASRLIEATSQLVVTLGMPTNKQAVDVFVNAYTDMHASVIAEVRQQQQAQNRKTVVDKLETVQREAVSVLSNLSRASVLSDTTSTTQLTKQTRHFAGSVNELVELIGMEHPWVRECDAALRQIQSVRHLSENATVPLNNDSHFGSLDAVTEHSRKLGAAMTSIARNAKAMDTAGFCASVRNSSEAVCSLAEAAAQSAYLVGVSHPESVVGRAALIDMTTVSRSVAAVKEACEAIERGQLSQEELLNATTSTAKHTSAIAQICRNASDVSSNMNVRKHLVNSTHDLASKTAALIEAVKQLDNRRTPEAEAECVRTSAEVRVVAEQLQSFVDNPDFSPIPARISDSGREAQIPVLASSRQMLDATSQMIRTAKDLAVSPMDATIWQRVADNSKLVSESIKKLVESIRDAAPGQVEIERVIQLLHQLIGDVERSAMDAYQHTNGVTRNPAAEKQLHQQIQHITNALIEEVDPLRTAAVAHGEHLPHSVELHWQLTADLANSACAAATLTANSNQQNDLFEKCRTVVEAQLQMMLACRDSGGNPNAVHAHSQVDDATVQLKHALGDMRATLAKIGNEQGVVQGMVDTISTSIASTDHTVSSQGSFADSQTRMTAYLEDIRRTAEQMPSSNTQSLGGLSLNLSEKYRLLASDTRQAVGMLPSANIAQKFKVSVQKLGTGCIDAVKVAGQRRAHPDDERINRELNVQCNVVIERVYQVLAALHEASRGTQACINAANTVSGIIGDLETTILFASSGTLNTSDQPKSFSTHRDIILKTAKALVEDTKALVAGAASNQEQLAVAAQNAVRTIVNLSDAVKNGAGSMSGENSEAQIFVIHAVRDVAAALASLIQATKNASGRSLQHPAMGQLKDAAKVMVSNVTGLLKTVKSVEDKQQQGTRALEAAVDAVTFEIRQFDADVSEGTSYATESRPEYLATAAEQISQATQKLTFAGNSMQQDDVIAAGNSARSAVRSLLAVSRAIASDVDTPESRYRILDGGRDVANQMKCLLVALHAQFTRSPTEESKQVLIEASRAVSKALRDLINACELGPHEGWNDAESTAQAESELLGAASSIEAASLKLAELRPRVSQTAENGGADGEGFDEKILSAAKSITSAVQTLVKAASNAQRELIAQGRLDVTTANSSDYQWSEGLVSAARLVAAAVQQLCEAANALVQGHASEEKLISAAKQVASTTAQLMLACNVKADMESQARKRLQVAGQAVKNATERLVANAKQIVSRDDRNIVISERLVSGIAQVMDAQEQVLRKEKELVDARERLAHLHKARYERVSPSE